MGGRLSPCFFVLSSVANSPWVKGCNTCLARLSRARATHAVPLCGIGLRNQAVPGCHFHLWVIAGPNYASTKRSQNVVMARGERRKVRQNGETSQALCNETLKKQG